MLKELLSSQHEVVSFDSEPLILVDDQDREIGYQDKWNCHLGEGILHRAFSLFIFNDSGELLLQQRSSNKRLWPLFWSNSCCSHPRLGETMPEAISRRLYQELGLTTHLEFLYKFKYQASYLDIGGEHELCWVFVGCTSKAIQPNNNEIAAHRFINAMNLEKELQLKPHQFTPWFKLEWQRLTQDYRNVLTALKVHLS